MSPSKGSRDILGIYRILVALSPMCCCCKEGRWRDSLYLDRHKDDENLRNHHPLCCYRVRSPDNSMIELYCRGYNVGLIARALAAVAALLFLLFLLYRHYDRSHLLFQRSKEVDRADFFHLAGSLRSEMQKRLTSDPSMCGYAAPNMRIYRRYMLLRDAGNFIDLFNPTLRVQEWALNVSHTEVSTMCEVEYPLSFVRASAVVVTFEDYGKDKVQLELSGRQAFCVQHFMDVFDGVWMCNKEEKMPYTPPISVNEL